MKTNKENLQPKPLHGAELLAAKKSIINTLKEIGLQHDPSIGIGRELGNTGQMISLHLNTPKPRQEEE